MGIATRTVPPEFTKLSCSGCCCSSILHQDTADSHHCCLLSRLRCYLGTRTLSCPMCFSPIDQGWAGLLPNPSRAIGDLLGDESSSEVSPQRPIQDSNWSQGFGVHLQSGQIVSKELSSDGTALGGWPQLPLLNNRTSQHKADSTCRFSIPLQLNGATKTRV